MLHQQLQIKVVVHNLSLLWLWRCIFFLYNCWLSWSMKESLILQEILVSQLCIGLEIPCHFDHELIESFNARISPTPFCPLQPSSSVQWSRSFRWQCCLSSGVPNYSVYLQLHILLYVSRQTRRNASPVNVNH